MEIFRCKFCQWKSCAISLASFSSFAALICGAGLPRFPEIAWTVGGMATKEIANEATMPGFTDGVSILPLCGFVFSWPVSPLEFWTLSMG